MITSLVLQNWKNHRNSQFEFKPSTNVIVGQMGSGKSSILQAISFALFGTFAELKSHDLKLAEVITRNSEALASEISIKLSLPDKRIIDVKRKVDPYKSGEATVRDEAGVLLAGPNPSLANSYLSTALGIKLDVFLRTIYAIQNEIDVILRITPAERKKQVDELMGLDKFEVARSNCTVLRNKLAERKRDAETWLSNFNAEQINSQLKDLSNQCEEFKSKKSMLSTDFKLSKDKLVGIKKALDALKIQMQELTSLKEQKKFLERKLADLAKKLAGKTLKKSDQQIQQEIAQIKNNISDLKKQKLDIVNQAEQNNQKLVKIEKDFGRLESQEIELNSRLAEIKRMISELEIMQKESEINQKLRIVKSELEMKSEQRQANLAEIRSLREQLETIETAEGVCPTCKSALTEDKKSRLIAERKKLIPDLLYTNNLLSEEIEKLKKAVEETEAVLEKRKTYSLALEEESKIISELQKIREFVKDLLPKKRALEETVTRHRLQTENIDKDLQALGETHLALIEERYLYESKSQKQAAEQELLSISEELAKKDVPSELFANQEQEYEMFLCRVREMETTLKSYDSLLAEKQARLQDLLNQKKQIDELSHNIGYMDKKIEFLDKFKNALLVAQTILRDDLILAVNEVMTAVWLEIYPYDKWSGVRLSVQEGDYVLELKESGGEWVSVVGHASGGERMLASLAARIAFAKVLVPNLSLLILDEPTHNLDEQAIKTLTEVIRSKLSNYVEQIFIVTHEEKLAEAAENVIRLN